MSCVGGHPVTLLFLDVSDPLVVSRDWAFSHSIQGADSYDGMIRRCHELRHK